MTDLNDKSREELVAELEIARRRIAEFEALEAERTYGRDGAATPESEGSLLSEREIALIRKEVMEFAGIGFVRYRFDGTILFMDRGAYNIFDLESIYPDPSATAGAQMSDVMVYTGPKGRLRKAIQEDGYVRNFEYPFETVTGKERWVMHNSYMVHDPESGEEIIQSIISDITAQKQAEAEHERLQQELIDAQQRAIQELSTPIIPVMEVPGTGSIIVMPLIGSIDSMRAKDLMRALLAGIREHRAKVVILDITGVPIVDSGVANHLNKTIQAARLKGARTIVTGISDAVAETVVDLGIDWSEIETLPDLQTGLFVALSSLGIKLVKA